MLSDSNAFVEDLRQRGVSHYSFTEFGGHGIVVETVRRFKGLESDALILVLCGSDYSGASRSLPYVGLSRAKTLLYVLASKGVKNALAWQ